MEDNQPIFEFTYNVSEADYINFNWLLLGDDIVNKKKRANITGGFMLLAAVLLGVQTIIFNKYNQYFLDFLILFVFFMGIYNLLFYRKIFPKSLEKNAIKVYKTTRFAKGDVTLKFFDEYITETSCEGDFNVPYSYVKAQYQNQELIVLFFNKRAIIINKNVVTDDLLEFLKVKL